MKSTLAVLLAVIGVSFAMPTEVILVDTSKGTEVQRQQVEPQPTHLDAINVQVYLSGGAATMQCDGYCLKDDDCSSGCKCNEARRRCVINY